MYFPSFRGSPLYDLTHLVHMWWAESRDIKVKNHGLKK